tara:strand:- start:93 stop:326 length:234 start_codon:yes stop_codon:yes gene_type:complete
MRIYVVSDLRNYTEHFPNRKEAMKVARERSASGKWHGVAKMELGKLNKAGVIDLLNGKLPEFERVWQLDPADDRIVD